MKLRNQNQPLLLFALFSSVGIGMDDDGFKDRVDKVFASISSSSSSSSWSLSSDAQVERRKPPRNSNNNNNNTRDDDDDNIPPVFSSFQYHDWDIRSSIGLDSTLDNEEEEDAYDKMARGGENGGDRLYMNDVTHHGPLYLNSQNVLPPAKTRLKQDDDSNAIIRIKSILKRKSYEEEVPKPAKRVRFDSTCKDADADADAARPDPIHVSGGNVPDYIVNPSNYTRYTLDDGEAYLEKSPEQSCGGDLLPKSLVFIPRKKSGGGGGVKQSSTQTIGIGIGIGIASREEGEEMMQEDDDDDVCTKPKSQKPVRRYRSKMEEYDDDDDDVS